MAGLDLATRAGALRFAELRREEMRRYYLTHGRLEKNPVFWVFANYAFARSTKAGELVGRGQKLDKVTALPCPFSDALWRKLGSDTTAYAGRIIKEVAAATKAMGVLLIMDAWVADGAHEPADQHYGWIEKDPEKREGLYASLEHKLIPRPMRWSAFIHRDPLRLDPWLGGELKGPDTSGNRLAGFVDWSS